MSSISQVKKAVGPDLYKMMGNLNKVEGKVEEKTLSTRVKEFAVQVLNLFKTGSWSKEEQAIKFTNKAIKNLVNIVAKEPMEPTMVHVDELTKSVETQKAVAARIKTMQKILGPEGEQERKEIMAIREDLRALKDMNRRNLYRDSDTLREMAKSIELGRPISKEPLLTNGPKLQNIENFCKNHMNIIKTEKNTLGGKEFAPGVVEKKYDLSKHLALEGREQVKGNKVHYTSAEGVLGGIFSPEKIKQARHINDIEQTSKSRMKDRIKYFEKNFTPDTEKMAAKMDLESAKKNLEIAFQMVLENPAFKTADKSAAMKKFEKYI